MQKYKSCKICVGLNDNQLNGFYIKYHTMYDANKVRGIGTKVDNLMINVCHTYKKLVINDISCDIICNQHSLFSGYITDYNIYDGDGGAKVNMCFTCFLNSANKCKYCDKFATSICSGIHKCDNHNKFSKTLTDINGNLVENEVCYHCALQCVCCDNEPTHIYGDNCTLFCERCLNSIIKYHGDGANNNDRDEDENKCIRCKRKDLLIQKKCCIIQYCQNCQDHHKLVTRKFQTLDDQQNIVEIEKEICKIHLHNETCIIDHGFDNVINYEQLRDPDFKPFIYIYADGSYKICCEACYFNIVD